MRVLDLFAGLGGWSAAFNDRGHHITTLDYDPRFGTSIVADILDVTSIHDLGTFDVVLASPPCETFSVAALGHHWGGGYRAYQPKTPDATRGLEIMTHTFRLIFNWGGSYVIENPRGLMRKLAPRPPSTTVWYCRFGARHAKPTDLWTNLGILWPPPCNNGNPDHEPAPRGSKTGTQGLGRADVRAEVPYGLSLFVCQAAENYLAERVQPS